MTRITVDRRLVEPFVLGLVAVGLAAAYDRYRNQKAKGDFIVLDTEPYDPDTEEQDNDYDDSVDADMNGIPLELTDDGEEEHAPIEYSAINIFAPSTDGWDEEYEASLRVDGEPHVIALDVFLENENDWTQETLTYYAGDDILADQSDTPIYGHANMMGKLKFGHGSQDRNVVYIRNPSLRREWEILRSDGKFEDEVTGLSMENEIESNELKHSYSRKFRDD